MIGVGYISKQDAFIKRHQRFFDRFQNLTAAISTAFDRTMTAAAQPLDPLIFYLGMRAVDDFEAIVVLVANDLALPAQSLLRGMYERVVTGAHLHSNPDDAAPFAEFEYVQRRKLVNAVKETLGESPESPEFLEELEREYARGKDRYMVSCEKCGHKRIGPSWSKLDFVTMAKRQENLAEMLVHGYYFPMMQTHSTLRSITSQLEMRDGKPAYRKEHLELSDEVLRTAHVLLLGALQTQVDHFKLQELESALGVAFADHVTLYADDDPP